MYESIRRSFFLYELNNARPFTTYVWTQSFEIKLHVPIVQSLATPAPLSDNYAIVKHPTEQIHGCTNEKRYKKDNNLSPFERAQ